MIAWVVALVPAIVAIAWAAVREDQHPRDIDSTSLPLAMRRRKKKCTRVIR